MLHTRCSTNAGCDQSYSFFDSLGRLVQYKSLFAQEVFDPKALAELIEFIESLEECTDESPCTAPSRVTGHPDAGATIFNVKMGRDVAPEGVCQPPQGHVIRNMAREGLNTASLKDEKALLDEQD